MPEHIPVIKFHKHKYGDVEVDGVPAVACKGMMACARPGDACKRQHTPNCIQKDDFTALIPEIDNCDASIPGSIMEKPDELKAADELVEWLLS